MAYGIQVIGAASLDHSGATSDEQLIHLWLEASCGSSHTRRAYLKDVESMTMACAAPLRALTFAQVSRWASGLTGAPSSIARRISAAKSLLSFGHETGYLPYNVGLPLKPPKLRNNLAQRILTEEEMVRILAASSDPVPLFTPGGRSLGAPPGRNHCLLRLLYTTGARVSEISGLDWEHIQPTASGAAITLHGKGGKTRHVFVGDGMAQELAAFRQPEAQGADPVFVGRLGRRLGARGILDVIKVIAKKAGITKPVSPHWFRHARASHALDRGAPIQMVQADLGHESLTTTSRYVHARPNDGSARFLVVG